jgi:shikimate dehydrogenase
VTTIPHAAIIGYPVKHSRSPLIHQFWLKEHGLAGLYDKAEVAPAEFEGFIHSLAANGYCGGNVTVPHKEAAFALCENLSASARGLGAVNTLWFEAGKLCGDNTDVAGFLGNLDEAAPGWDGDPGKAVVLGAGGAARAILFGLSQRGFRDLVIVNRNQERAEALGRDLGLKVKVASWAEAGSALDGAGLLVNTTSLGMAGQPPLELDLAPLPEKAIVNDIVYVPLETPLLERARQRGLRVVDGLGMLLHQAVPGFERWFGKRPQVTPQLRALIEADVIGARK